MGLLKRKSRKNDRRNDVMVELTVRVNFGDDFEPVVLVDDLKVPFVQLAIDARSNIGSLLMQTVLKAASFRPAVMRQLLFPSK